MTFLARLIAWLTALVLAVGCSWQPASTSEPSTPINLSAQQLRAGFPQNQKPQCAIVWDGQSQVQSYCAPPRFGFERASAVCTRYDDADGWKGLNRFISIDIDGDHNSDLIVRDRFGTLEYWRSNGTEFTLISATTGTPFTDGGGWDQENRFFALDVDPVHPGEELIARWDNGGFAVWRYDAATQQIVFLRDFPTPYSGAMPGNRFFVMNVAGDERRELVARDLSGSFSVWSASGGILTQGPAVLTGFWGDTWTYGNRFFVLDIDGAVGGYEELVARHWNGAFEIWHSNGVTLTQGYTTPLTGYTDTGGWLIGNRFLPLDVDGNGTDELVLRWASGTLDVGQFSGGTFVVQFSVDSPLSDDDGWLYDYEGGALPDPQTWRSGNRFVAKRSPGLGQQDNLVLRTPSGTFESWHFANTQGAGNLCVSGGIICQNESASWYQDAINQAQANAYSKVSLDPGVLTLERRLPSGWPTSLGVGIQVPSNIHLEGSKVCGNTTLVRVPQAIRDTGGMDGTDCAVNCKLSALITLANNPDNIEISPPVQNASISYLSLDGAGGSSDSRGIIRKPEQIHVVTGVAAPLTSGQVSLHHLKIRHVEGNAIDTGAYASGTALHAGEAYVAPSDAGPGNLICNGDLAAGNRFCESKVYRFSGDSGRNLIHDNDISDARFGGITIIGGKVDIFNNQVHVSDRWWKHDKELGSTMGISASFIDTDDVRVYDNTLEGGDYGIGTDGSFPLYLNDGLVWNYWQEICAHLCTPDQNGNTVGEYCDAYKEGTAICGPTPTSYIGEKCNLYTGEDGNPVPGWQFCGGDQVFANQVLLDKAAEVFVSNDDCTDDYKGFGNDLYFARNHIEDAMCGISLWRMKSTWIEENEIIGGPESGVHGINLADSESNWIYGNEISQVDYGIKLSGSSCGGTRFGSSFNGIGVRYIPETEAYVTVGNVIDALTGIYFDPEGNAQFNNSIRGNSITVPAQSLLACVTSSGHTTPDAGDWTTDNQPTSCNNNDYGVAPLPQCSSACE